MPTPVDARSRGVDVAVVALVAVVLEATLDVLPDAPLLWVLTPLRLIILVGLAGLLVAGPAPRLPRIGSHRERFGSCPDRRFRPPVSARSAALAAAVAMLVATAGLVVLTSGHGGPQWRGLVTSVAAACLAGGVLRRRPGAWPAIGSLTLIAVAAAGGIAVAQTAGGTPTGFCRAALDGSADSCRPGAMIRAIGPFYNPNILAAFLVLLLPAATAAALALRDSTSRVVALSCVTLGVVALPLTGSRGGLLAAVAGVAAALILRRPSRLRLYLGAGAVVSCLLGALTVLALGVGIGLRPDVWRAGLRLAFEHPLGVGLGRAGVLLDAAIPGTKEFQHAHNLWLNWLVEAGPAALVAVVAVTVLVGSRLVAAARAGSVPAVALGAGLTAFAVMSIADHPANAVRIDLVLWTVLGLAAATRPAPD